MSYYITKTVETTFEKAIERVTETLRHEGFGVLSTIDIREKFKEKLDVDFKKYVILGACNPSFAHKALLAEDKIGVLLPCNVIVQEHGDGTVEVSAVDPEETMKVVQSKQMGALALEVRCGLRRAIEEL